MYSGVEGVYRIGKPLPNKKRLVRVVCVDRDTKIEALKNAKVLRTLDKYDGIFVNADLTPYQQKEQRNLRQELKRRREANENVKIYRGKIIQIDSKQNFQ